MIKNWHWWELKHQENNLKLSYKHVQEKKVSLVHPDYLKIIVTTEHFMNLMFKQIMSMDLYKNTTLVNIVQIS